MPIDDFKKTIIKNDNKWILYDTTWALCLFGTAIGAGILFLPINAGIGGIIPLLIITVIAFPITFYAHCALSRFVLSTSNPEAGITGAILEHFGKAASNVFNFIYFFAIFTILLMYSVAVTNTTESFMIHQLKIPSPNRAILSLVLILSLLMIVRFGKTITIKIMSMIVYPFIASLIFLSLWLIPQWNTAIFHTVILSTDKSNNLFFTVWMILPVLVLSFNHYPIISPFVVDVRKKYGEKLADKKCIQIQRYGNMIMVAIVLLFVFSCVLSLTPKDLALAKIQNISILSYMANHFETPVMIWIGPIIAFVAIMKSFLGHYIGAHETGLDIIMRATNYFGIVIQKKTIDKIILIFIILSCWYTACKNPSILGLIENISGPTGAIIVLLLPMYAIHKLPVLATYKGRLSNFFVTFIGLITVAAIFYNIIAQYFGITV